jgi:hypothetical protein
VALIYVSPDDPATPKESEYRPSSPEYTFTPASAAIVSASLGEIELSEKIAGAPEDLIDRKSVV